MKYTKDNIIGLVFKTGVYHYRVIPPSYTGDFSLISIDHGNTLYNSVTYTIETFNKNVEEGNWEVVNLDKWAVARTGVNAKELNAWANKNFPNRNFSSNGSIYIHSDKFDGTHYTSAQVQQGYIEVSWYYFKEYIMNSPKISTPLINNSYEIY